MRENVLSMAAGSIGTWWTGRLSVFWRAQIVGWGLFFLVDLVNRVLTYRSFRIALVITLVVTPCLVVVSAGMRLMRIGLSLASRTIQLSPAVADS